MLDHRRAPAIATMVLCAATLAAGADVDGPFGVYPDCVAPAIPLEVHSWWWENGETVARHVHLAACLPNARDLTGELVSIASPQSFTVRIVSFNNPSAVSWARWSWESDVMEVVDTEFACQTTIGEMQECSWTVEMTLDPDLASSGGMRELRLSPNVPHDDLDTRQFATLNYQVYLHNGQSEQNYRPRTNPIGRSWYTDLEYANAELNYIDFFDGAADLNRTVPTVSGVVPLEIRHREGQQAVRGTLWENVNFHATPGFHQTAQVGVPNAAGSRLLYEQAGNWDGTYQWDTRGLANGRNVLYLQTEETDDTGTNAGAIKLFFDVDNPTLHLDVTHAALDWNALPSAVSYDVIRGDLAQLRQTGGAFDTATDGCLATDWSVTSVGFPAQPLPDQGWWFLVRGNDADGPISYESQSASQHGARDHEISQSPASCPN